MPRVTKAVVPAAGLGTRFLPATKALPKEMLPVVDRPAVQYVVEEAVAAGLLDVLMITGRNKNALENHFDRATELEATLLAKGDAARLSEVQGATGLADLHYVRQGDPLGLGHAVLRAKSHVGDASFAVLLGDDLIDPATPVLERMLAVHDDRGSSVIALMEVDPSETHRYGIATVTPTGDDGVVRVTDLVEKPAPGTAPSNLAVIGRYVLQPAIFELLERTAPGSGGEVQLTDALQAAAVAPDLGVHGVIHRGRRFDTGDKLGYLQANISLASERDDLGPELRAWLRQYVATFD